jgi:hypothetical protein
VFVQDVPGVSRCKQKCTLRCNFPSKENQSTRLCLLVRMRLLTERYFYVEVAAKLILGLKDAYF